jgi:hypothetical protein
VPDEETASLLVWNFMLKIMMHMKHTFKQPVKKSSGTLAGYVFAALVAIQPLVNDEIEFSNRVDLLRFIFRIAVSVMIAVLSRYLSMRGTAFTQNKNPELPG